MIIFRSIKESLLHLGIRSPKQFHRLNFRNTIIFTYFITCTTLMSLSFIYEDGTIAEYSSVTFGLISSAVTAFYISNLISKTWKVYNLIDHFEDLVRKRCKYPELKSIYEDANKRIEKWTERIQFWFTTLTIWIFMTIFIATLVILTIIKYTKGLNNFEYTPMFREWLPFDKNKFPIGYSLAFGFDVSFIFLCTSCCGLLLKFLNGSCIILTAYTNDIKQEFWSLNDRQKSENPNQTEIHLKLIEIIKFHSEAKQLVNDLSDIYQFILTVYLGWCLLTICVTLLVFQSEISKGAINAVNVIVACNCLMYAFGILFAYCELGEQISSGFGQIENEMYQMDWHLFPMKTQRMMVIILMNTQQLVEFIGYGNISANRETMKRIGNAGCSYFLICREFI